MSKIANPLNTDSTRPVVAEFGILIQSENLSLRQGKNGVLDLFLEGHTHAVHIGSPKSVAAAEKTIQRLETPSSIRNLCRMYQHFA